MRNARQFSTASWLLSLACLASFSLDCAPLSAADRELTRDSMALKGPVRVLAELEVSDISPSNPEGIPFARRSTTFSTDGEVIEIDDCSTIPCEHTDFFWQGAQVLEEHWENQYFIKTIRYFYAPNGLLAEMDTEEGYKRASSISTYSVTVYTDTESGREEREYCNGVLSSRRITEVQDDPTITAVSDYHSVGDLGRQSHIVLGSVHTDFSAPNPGDRTRTISEFGTGKSFRETDAKGRTIEEGSDNPNEYSRLTHTYDDRGWEVERSEWRRDGNMINRRTFTYEVDLRGNWIRRTEQFGSAALAEPVPGQVTIRKIEYY